MDKITDEVIAGLEKAAMVSLADQERIQVKADLDQLLTYLSQLPELPATADEPAGSAWMDRCTCRTDDAVKVAPNVAAALVAAAPQAMDGWYMVPETIAKQQEKLPDDEG